VRERRETHRARRVRHEEEESRGIERAGLEHGEERHADGLVRVPERERSGAEPRCLEAVRGQEVDEQVRDLELLAAAMRDDEEPPDDPRAERQGDQPDEVRADPCIPSSAHGARDPSASTGAVLTVAPT
jgi:hypothetical protein